MTQANPIIGAGKTGLQYRAADNDGKQALLNHHKGGSAPSYKEGGVLWIDDSTTPWKLKLYDGADWITLMEVNATANTVRPYLGAAAFALANYAADTGAVNAYAIAPSPAVAAYAAGQLYLLKPANVNTGAATIAVSGLIATAIKMPDGNDPPAGALTTTGAFLLFYDGTNFLLINPAGLVGVNRAYAEYLGTTGITSSISDSDTIPQISQGTQILTATLTPRSSTSRIRVTISGYGSTAGTVLSTVAYFLNGAASAISAFSIGNSDASFAGAYSNTFEYAPGTTAAQVISVNVGPRAGGTFYPNSGIGGGRLYGGIGRTTLVLEEISA